MGRRQVQLGLALPAPVVVVKHGWGGARKGAGRKKVSEHQSHRMREAFSKRMPVHVTMKMAKNVKGLRGRRMYKAVEAALWAAARNEDGLVCDFSVQNDHLHLVIDAANNKARQGDAECGEWVGDSGGQGDQFALPTEGPGFRRQISCASVAHADGSAASAALCAG